MLVTLRGFYVSVSVNFWVHIVGNSEYAFGFPDSLNIPAAYPIGSADLLGFGDRLYDENGFDLTDVLVK